MRVPAFRAQLRTSMQRDAFGIVEIQSRGVNDRPGNLHGMNGSWAETLDPECQAEEVRNSSRAVEFSRRA